MTEDEREQAQTRRLRSIMRVRAPIERVIVAVADPSVYRFSRRTRITKDPPGPTALGTRFSIRGRARESTWEIVRFEPPTAVAIRVEIFGRAATTTYLLTEEGDLTVVSMDSPYLGSTRPIIGAVDLLLTRMVVWWGSRRLQHLVRRALEAEDGK